MYTLKGIDFLRSKLSNKRSRCVERYEFYEMKNAVPDWGVSTPPVMRKLNSICGWSAKAVDTFADRINLKGFRNDPFDLDGIFNAASCRDLIFDDAILSASIASCSFIYISNDDDGEVQMQVIDGKNATGVIDPVTHLLYEGYAILDVDPENKLPVLEAYFCPEYTEYYEVGKAPYKISNPTGYPLLVPVVLRPDAVRPFGHSRITRACQYYQCAAARTMKRSEIMSEFYSFPQKYVTGLPENAPELDYMERWKSAMSAMMTFYNDQDGNSPKPGQFQAASMSPHVDHLKMWASLFAGESGLTLGDLGFPLSNPSSEGTVKAEHADLNRMCARGARQFGVGLKNAGFVAMCLSEKAHVKRKELGNVLTVWHPIFKPDASELASVGDGLYKLSEAYPALAGNGDILFDYTGIEV